MSSDAVTAITPGVDRPAGEGPRNRRQEETFRK
ncbi:MAG: TetR/AcrR family transcriptional regulator, partial [Mycobacterium sp.]